MSNAVISGFSAPNHDGIGAQIVIGPTFTGFLDRVAPATSIETLRSDSVSILSQCAVSGDDSSRLTGLIVGRVQSGKTLSYEGVIALARDNGFAMVVVISGISNPLLNQGVTRLKRDLTEADPEGWNFLVNPDADAQVEATMRSIRDNWSDPQTPAQLKKTAVCLLLKHHGRIDAFSDLCERVGWAGLKVLVIDDEADQASLNVSFRRGRASATYGNILKLRDTFPHHAYLQYTATPQAPLLIAISDALSPDFVRVLDPGSEYVGGAEYFGAANGLVKVIPESDLLRAADVNGGPPATLTQALREFLLGAAFVVNSGELATRSMLVHPSRLTEPHATFVRWIKTIVDHWRAVLEDADDLDALRAEFADAWASLASTAPELTDFDATWVNLRFVLRNLQLVEMNTRDGQGTPQIDWDSSKAYILIGGQALDRGFTVNGLSVTYMSRDPGAWTADTIQQRARFFGYKRKFLGQCRVYLEPGLRDAFEMYVEHERRMILSLKEIQGGRSSLKAWRRQFLLDPAMRPTRQSVTSLPTIAIAPGERWIYDPRPSVGFSADTSERGLQLFFDGLEWATDEYGHARASAPMGLLLDIMEAHPEVAGVALPQFAALKLQIAHLIDDVPTIQASLIRMRPSIESVRSLTSAGSLQPFQGRSAGYPGDRAIRSENVLSVQVHRFAIRRTQQDEPFGSMVALAFWLPDELASGWLVEDEQ